MGKVLVGLPYIKIQEQRSRQSQWCGNHRCEGPSASLLTQGLNPGLPHCRQTLYCLSHISIVPSVHFRIVRCHQFKKRHHIWLLWKVFADLEKVFSLKWRCPPPEAFHWWRGECSADPAVRLIVECSVGMSPGQEGIVLRIKWQTQDFWSQLK